MGLLDRWGFAYALDHPWFFRHVARPLLFRRYGDPERVHDVAIRTLGAYDELLARNEPAFPELEVTINGQTLVPFGTAAGLDKNADAMLPLSRVFGFLEPGTILVSPREGNPKPRVAVDGRHENLYNAQGFPSRGMDAVGGNLLHYRTAGGAKPVYANVCGLPRDGDVGRAVQEMDELVDGLERYVDGFVWNPASPNTQDLVALRTRESFRRHAELIRDRGKGKLALVKLWPYEPGSEHEVLALAAAWVESGGDGFVAVNTRKVPYDWPYGSAGTSGRALGPYRTKAVRDLRHSFPDSVIVAAGGIFDSDDAYETLKVADAVEGYTPYAYYGVGLARQLMRGVRDRLRDEGYRSLAQMQAAHRSRPRTWRPAVATEA